MGFQSARIVTSLAFLLTAAAFTQTAPAPQSRQAADALVRRTVNKEVADMQNPADFWRYHLRKESASGSQTRDMVETKQGIVARTIAVNDQPLTPEQRSLFLEEKAALEQWRAPRPVFIIIEQDRAVYWRRLLLQHFHVYHQVASFGTCIILSNQM